MPNLLAKSRVTIIDIAAAAGVSKSTVSLVLKGSASVRSATRERVNAAIKDFGYVYNRGAANLRRASSNVIGIVINDLTNPYFAELAVGIERGLQASGHVCFIANSAENPARQAEVIQLMREQGVAGMIVSAARGTPDSAFDDLIEAGVPLILAMRGMAGRRAALVEPDNRRGAQLAVGRLIALGHRRIAFLGGHKDSVVRRDRFEGFARGLLAAGLNPRAAIDAPTAPTREGGLAALEIAINQPEPPTAALCFNDIVAFGVCRGLRKRGIRPGSGFAVIGFDDVEEAAHSDPPLTTVAVDVMSLGERAAQAMLKVIASGANRAEDHIGAVHLAVRESCGGPIATGRP